MLWLNKKQSTQSESTTIDCQKDAEALYRSGKYNCAESVLESIRKKITPEIPDSVVSSVSGFGGGSGSGCICGAVSGGTVAIGLVLNDKNETTKLTKELHKWFKEKYGVTCCKVIRAKNGKELCPVLTGEVAAKIAEMLTRR